MVTHIRLHKMAKRLLTNNDPTVTFIHEENDVLLGRGAYCNNHIGNIRLRELCFTRRQEYESALDRKTKTSIAYEIVASTISNGGRFLRQATDVERAQIGGGRRSGGWVIAELTAVLEKIKHTLREKVKTDKKVRAVKGNETHSSNSTGESDLQDQKPVSLPQPLFTSFRNVEAQTSEAYVTSNVHYSQQQMLDLQTQQLQSVPIPTYPNEPTAQHHFLQQFMNSNADNHSIYKPNSLHNASTVDQIYQIDDDKLSALDRSTPRFTNVLENTSATKFQTTETDSLCVSTRIKKYDSLVTTSTAQSMTNEMSHCQQQYDNSIQSTILNSGVTNNLQPTPFTLQDNVNLHSQNMIPSGRNTLQIPFDSSYFGPMNPNNSSTELNPNPLMNMNRMNENVQTNHFRGLPWSQIQYIDPNPISSMIPYSNDTIPTDVHRYHQQLFGNNDNINHTQETSTLPSQVDSQQNQVNSSLNSSKHAKDEK